MLWSRPSVPRAVEAGRLAVTVLTVPLFAFFTVLTVLVLAAGLRLLMGITLSPLRTVIAALIALFSASPIITAMAGAAVSRKHPGILPGLWFVFLGVVIALLVGMIFLVISEALVPSGSLPGPLYVLRGARRTARRARRYSQIIRILARHGLIPHLRGGRRLELATPEGRARLARSLRLALEDGGVTFVKLGQVLSTRRDSAAAGVHQRAEPASGRRAQGAVAGHQRGAGSLARRDGDREVRQLRHRADRGRLYRPGAQGDAAVRGPGGRQGAPTGRDRRGRLRPGYRAAAGDPASAQHPAGPLAGAVNLADGFAAALREELDLRIEARNMTAVAAAARGEDLPVPAPYQPYCGERVLVMQYLNGRPLLTAAPGLPADPRAALARVLLDSLLGQVMLDGIFHADPHPGNILLLGDGHLGLIDWGAVGRIDAGLRGALQRLLLALVRGDPVILTDALLDVVNRPEQLDEPRLDGRWAGSWPSASRQTSRPTRGCSPACSASSPTTGSRYRRR